VAIAAWEGDIDRERAHAVLDGTWTPDDAPLADAPVDAAITATARHA
jgi:aerobic C4-dicarboxylate transport protein